MLTRSLTITVLGICAIAAHAGPLELAGVADPSMDLLPAQQQLRALRSASMAVTEEEVGDVDSFGRAKTYLGVTQTLPVIMQADCTGFDPESGVCIETAVAPGGTLVDEVELGSIDLPGSATESLLCFTVTQFSTWLWNNTTAVQATGSMFLYTTVQIENDVLLGLNDINGNPFNGKLFASPNPIIVSSHQHTLPPAAFEVQRERTTRSCTGGFVSARSLAARGLTDAQIKDFFKEPMTVSFGVAGSASLVDFVNFFSGIRLYGD